MTNHVVRLYSAGGTLLAFFLLWATIAAHPWNTSEQVTSRDPRLVALAERERRLQRRAADVKRIIEHRWALYERRLAQRQRQNAVALQRHVQQLEASQAAAVLAARAAVAQTSQARAYAASVVAWANQQLAANAPSTAAAATGSAPATPSRARRSTTPRANGTTVAARFPVVPQGAAAPAAGPVPPPTQAPVTAPTPAPAATPETAPVTATAPAAAPPPVQVVTLPPITTTKPSAKKK